MSWGLSKARLGRRAEADEGLLVPVTTLVVWLGCAAVGVAGLTLPYALPRPPMKPFEPIQAAVLQVELAPETAGEAALSIPSPASGAAPMLPGPPPSARRPELVAVAEPVRFIGPAPLASSPEPVLTTGAERVLSVSSEPVLVPPQSRDLGAGGALPVQAITYGRGDGRQPAPPYPRQAARDGQEGSVAVRFTVAEDGRVLAAEAAAPSPWPLLNDAAVRTVRERWRFAPGLVRRYEVAIRFELKR